MLNKRILGPFVVVVVAGRGSLSSLAILEPSFFSLCVFGQCARKRNSSAKTFVSKK
jgi:hypothetical protein